MNNVVSMVKMDQPICITYFNENGIKIQKICLSLYGSFTFFISDNGQLYHLYGCGKNKDGIYGLMQKYQLSVQLTLSNWCRLYRISTDIIQLL